MKIIKALRWFYFALFCFFLLGVVVCFTTFYLFFQKVEHWNKPTNKNRPPAHKKPVSSSPTGSAK